MATPIVELIEQTLLTTLAGITTTAGYEVTLAVERAESTGNVPADLKCVVSRGPLRDADETKEEQHVPLLHDGYVQPFDIVVWRAQNATDVDAALADADSDIRKIVNTNYTLGGRVQNIFWKPSEPIYIGELPGLKVTLEALFFTALNNPYSQ